MDPHTKVNHSASNSIGSFLDYYSTSVDTANDDGYQMISRNERKLSIQSSRTSLTVVRDGIELKLNVSKQSRVSSDPLLLGDRDRYGFKKLSSWVSAHQHDEWWKDYSKYLIRRKKRWEMLMHKNGYHVTNSSSPPTKFPPRSDELKRFVRKGIPAEWRGNAWFHFAKGHDKLRNNVGLYDTLCDKALLLHNENTEAIEKDLNRTFPDNIHFNNPDHKETPLVQSLRRVLSCFAIYKPQIGYCQSLNFIAGLLLIFMDEEKSFWMLVIMTERYLPGIHDMTLEGVNVHQGVLLLCIKEYLPNVWPMIVSDSEKDSNNFLIKIPPLSLCTTSWFMSVFIGVLPIETTLRVWDCIFYEDSKTIFRISLTIFKLIEPELLSLKTNTHANDDNFFNIEIFQILQNYPKRLINCNFLMESCFKKNNGFGNLSQLEINNCKKFVKEKREKYSKLNGDSLLIDDLERQRLIKESLEIYGDKKMGLRGLSWNGKLNNKMKLIQHKLR